MKNKDEDKRCKVYNKKYKLHLIGVSELKERKKRTEAISEEIMSKNCP